MAEVIIEGVFMAANIKTSEFEGKKTSSVYIDLYQPTSTANEKTVSIKSDDLELFSKLTADYAMGSVFTCKAQVNAYKNKAYYKLIAVL